MDAVAWNSYNSALWDVFRGEVIELDGSVCRRCHRGVESGVVLQVHHKRYETGRLPWDYAYSDCETLCKGCHAAEHGIIRPRVGWTCVGENDLGDLCGNCELCGTEIRYVFLIHHPQWEPLAVGTICCDNLTETQIASNKLESLHRFISRKQRFLSSLRWKGNEMFTSIRQKGMTIGIRKIGQAYRIEMEGRKGKKKFPTSPEAKAEIFEIIEDGRAAAYLMKIGVLQSSNSGGFPAGMG
jgi:hypothetical protein